MMDDDNDIYVIQNVLRRYIETSFEQRDHAWNHELYGLAASCFYELIAPLTGPDGRRYMAVKICPPEVLESVEGQSSIQDPMRRVEQNVKGPTIKNMASLSRFCVERGLGMAIITDSNNPQPKVKFRLGSMWSFFEFRHLGGPTMLVHLFEDALKKNPENPMDAELSDLETFSIGSPSDELFPPYIRGLMGEEIQRISPNSHASYVLRKDDKYIMPFTILIDGVVADIALKEKIQNDLLWFMPPYLPISLR